MGLDQYLYADFRASSDSPLVKVVKEHINADQQAELDRDGDLYVSGWTFGTGPTELFKALVEESGIAPTESSPSISVSRDDAGGWVFSFTVAYWRKANHIHAWFVDQCQGGVDECQPSDPIHPEKLAELYTTVKDVLANPDTADESLPTRPGFFFGGTDYDEYYRSDLELTKNHLESIFANQALKAMHITFHYQSSW